jgi:hypothetical protein
MNNNYRSSIATNCNSKQLIFHTEQIKNNEIILKIINYKHIYYINYKSLIKKKIYIYILRRYYIWFVRFDKKCTHFHNKCTPKRSF